VLEKLFHAVWWDYSRLPLNIQGRVSFFTSCGFGLAGVLIVYVLLPRIGTVTAGAPAIWVEGISLVLAALLAADTTLTVSALTDFASRVKRAEEALNGHMEAFVANTRQRGLDAKERLALEGRQLSEKLTTMGDFRSQALHRVRALRYPRIDNERLSALLKELRQSLHKNGKR